MFNLNSLRGGPLSFILSLPLYRVIVSNQVIKLVYYLWPDRRLGCKGRNFYFLPSTSFWAGMHMEDYCVVLDQVKFFS